MELAIFDETTCVGTNPVILWGEGVTYTSGSMQDLQKIIYNHE